ncbi:MAG TPA: MarR family transcriptional regulator [Actinomycetes bacterium]|nr:MarR family transcriptional regulator [Actinomycetes bacterium]
MSDAGPQADTTAAWAALLRAHAALVPRLDRELRAAVGVPLAWYDVLLELYAAPNRRLRMSDLGERVVLSRSRVSRVVDELVTAGLVQREINPEDGRSALAALTDTGLARFRSAAPVYLEGIERHFTRYLTARERETIARALNRALAAEPAVPPRRPRLTNHAGR